MIPFFKDSGGSPLEEKNDCTVRAQAVATGRPYHDCYMLLSTFGRKPNKGTSAVKFFSNNKCFFGHVFRKLKFRKPVTLRKFVKRYPEGTYYVRKSRHVYVVKDGVAIDTFRPKPLERITDAWEVVPLEQFEL